VLHVAARYRGHRLMEELLNIYLGNRRASLILIIQIVSPCDYIPSHTRLACVLNAPRMRLECASNAYHNRNAAHSQQNEPFKE
jgi:hypothetical protein